MGDSQTEGVEERIDEGDNVKFRPFGHPITANEVHAAQLGLIGVFTGLAYASGMTSEALGASALLIGVTLGFRSLPDEAPDDKVMIAVNTKRHEPWWFITSYVITFLIGMTIHGGI